MKKQRTVNPKKRNHTSNRVCHLWSQKEGFRSSIDSLRTDKAEGLRRPKQPAFAEKSAANHPGVLSLGSEENRESAKYIFASK